MNVLLRKYFWIFNLAVIATCAYFAASALNSCLVTANLPVATPRGQPRGLGRPPSTIGPRTRDISAILARNIFCSTCQPAIEVAPAAVAGGGNGNGKDPKGTSGLEGAVKSTLNLQLIVTLVSEKEKAWSYAALHDPTANKTRMYGIGQKLVGHEGTVVDVLERRILLTRENRTEYIDLAQGDQRVAGMPKPMHAVRTPYRSAFSKFTDEIASGVRKVGPNKYEISRSALNKVLGNTTMLARSARIVPSVRNGQPNGFKLYAIRPGSVYSLIGMQNGDTIHAINGHSITTPDKALAVYTKVRNASHLTIAYSRGGQSSTNDYTIR